MIDMDGWDGDIDEQDPDLDRDSETLSEMAEETVRCEMGGLASLQGAAGQRLRRAEEVRQAYMVIAASLLDATATLWWPALGRDGYRCWAVMWDAMRDSALLRVDAEYWLGLAETGYYGLLGTVMRDVEGSLRDGVAGALDERGVAHLFGEFLGHAANQPTTVAP